MAGAKRVEELICWTLTVEIRDRVLRLLATGGGRADQDFKDQIRAAARSAPANLAEGFGAFSPREFARFARIARRSILETRNHLREARTHQYFASGDIEELWALTLRAQKATTQLIRYLDSCNGRAPAAWNPRG